MLPAPLKLIPNNKFYFNEKINEFRSSCSDGIGCMCYLVRWYKRRNGRTNYYHNSYIGCDVCRFNVAVEGYSRTC